MARSLSLEIQCSVCLGDFSDPVILPCKHSFCRACISGHVNASIGPILCPECRQPFASTEVRVSRLLRNLTLSVRGHLDTPGQGQASFQRAPGPQDDLVCGEHDEKLKLFCVTDQRLVCTICKEQDKHQGHAFKPVKEAADNNKGVLKGALGFIMKENQALYDLNERQLSEIAKCEKRSAALKGQISSQFEALHQFLRRREKELHQELEEKRSKTVAAMQGNLSTIQGKAADGQEMEVVLRTALDIPKPDHYLQWWQSKGYPITEGMKERRDGQTKFKSNVRNLVVTPDSVSMGPYESHLPFFVWKEMLQTIKPGPEHLSIKDPGDSYLKVSPEGHSIRQVDRSASMYKTYNPSASTTQNFKTGRHYCELEVGAKQSWSIGLKVEMTKGAKLELPEKEIQLHLKNGGFVFSHDGTESPVTNASKSLPRRIGLYLDCDRQQVSFYNADTMNLIHSSFCSFLQPCSISVCPGLYMDGKNTDPVTFCWH